MGGIGFTIKVCPYCERYRRCPWVETCSITVPVEQRKEIARLCLQDVIREEEQGIYDGELPLKEGGGIQQ